MTRASALALPPLRVLRDRMDRSAEAQEGAITVAAIMGQPGEERRRKASLRLIRGKQERLDTDNAHVRLAAYRAHAEAKRIGKKDFFARMCEGETPLLTDAQFRAGLALRDYYETSIKSPMANMEAISGGGIQNGQMEAQTDQRFRSRIAMQKARDAIDGDARLKEGVIRIIIFGMSLTRCCNYAGIGRGSEQSRRVKQALWDATDAAAAHLGISR